MEGFVKGFVKRLAFLGLFYLSSRCVNLDVSLEKNRIFARVHIQLANRFSPWPSCKSTRHVRTSSPHACMHECTKVMCTNFTLDRCTVLHVVRPAPAPSADSLSRSFKYIPFQKKKALNILFEIRGERRVHTRMQFFVLKQLSKMHRNSHKSCNQMRKTT